MVRALESLGVRCVFGLPGTQLLELFEALRGSSIRTVVATNELSAAFMAGGWARVTGEPGVLLTMPGPGFMSALNGIAEARLDGIPLVHITGTVGNENVGRRFRQQALAQAAIASPLVKGVFEADTYSDPGVAALDAFQLAGSPNPGPVLLQVSPAMLSKEFEATSEASIPSAYSIGSAAFEPICEKLSAARRPLIFVGEGINKHSPLIRKAVERLAIPVLTAPSARGIFPETHRFYLGFDPFATDIRELNEFIATCDLVLAIGVRFSHSNTAGFQLTLAADRLVHVGESNDIVGVNYPSSLQLIAEGKDMLEALLVAETPSSSWNQPELETWRSRLKSQVPTTLEPRVAGTTDGDPRGFFQALRRALPDDAILVLDSGLHQILARRHYRVEAPCGLLIPTDLQSMGFAIPTAIGARLAAPSRAVVALLGDGGFAMTAMELLTAARENLSLTVIVFADRAFGQIRLQQLEEYGAGHGVTLQNPDFMLLAEAVSAHYELIGANDLERVVGAAVARAGVTVIEVPVGDSFGIRRGAAVARLREATRQRIGPRVVGWIKKLVARLQ